MNNKEINRREFMKITGLAAAVTGIAGTSLLKDQGPRTKTFYSVKIQYATNPCGEVALYDSDKKAAEAEASRQGVPVNFRTIRSDNGEVVKEGSYHHWKLHSKKEVAEKRKLSGERTKPQAYLDVFNDRGVGDIPYPIMGVLR